MDQFSYFLTFYSIVLGLAVTELLGGFARMVRARAVRKLEPQTALVALLTLIMIMSSWVDGWLALKSTTIDLSGLWAPVLIAIFYYIAASVIFPHDEADYDRLADYYAERRRFIIAMLLAVGMLTHVIYRHFFMDQFRHAPAVFWLWIAPYNVAVDAVNVALLFATGRRWNIILLALLTLLITIPYWEFGLFRHMIARAYGYA